MGLSSIHHESDINWSTGLCGTTLETGGATRGLKVCESIREMSEPLYPSDDRAAAPI